MTKRLGKSFPYEIIRELGSGGMGTVFLVRDPHTAKEMVLKMLRPEYKDHAELKKRFGREVRIASSLEHPNIIRIFTFNMDSDEPWFVMEFCKEGSLAEISTDRDAKQTIKQFIQACRGIAHAHSRGVLHRDIKPWNILVGNDGLVKVSDFGLALMVDRDSTPITPSGVGLGTYGFMSPEQMADAKHVTETADVYSLGATLFYLLTGFLPAAHIVRPGVLFAGLSKAEEDSVFKLIDQCLERSPVNRPQTAEQLAVSLEQAIGIVAEARDPEHSIDAETVILKVLELSNKVSEEELAMLKKLRSGEEIPPAVYQLHHWHGLIDTSAFSILWSLKSKELVMFREVDISSGKYPQNFYLTDIAITSLGLALLRYVER